MQKSFRYMVMCESFEGVISIKMDDVLPKHARDKVVKLKAEESHGKNCPDKTKHGYHVHFMDEETLH